MKIIRIAWKAILEMVKDYRALLISFAFPISFIIIFGWALGSNYYTAKIFVINNDKGIGTTAHYGNDLIEMLGRFTYEDGTNIFKLKTINERSEVGKRIEKREYAALIIIPADFTSTLYTLKTGKTLAEAAEKHSTPVVEIIGDPGAPTYGLVKLIFDAAFNSFISMKTGYSPPVATQAGFLSAGAGKGSEFNYLAPGLMLMAIYFMLIQVAMVLAQEVEHKTITRLKMSGVRTWEYLAGMSLSQVVFAIVMVPMMLYTAVMMGFNSRGSLLTGIFFGIIASISAVAIALIVAAFSKTEKEAFLWGNIITIPVIFFSGIFFPLPEIMLFKIGGTPFTVFDLQPTTHAQRAFLQVFLYGAGIGDLLYELSMLLIITAVYFVIGVFLYRRAHLRTN
jgi:ABC-2 type transport system permease protein